MIRFNNDYSEICHETVLNYISSRSAEQNAGYGMDDYCVKAADLIKKQCENEHVAVHFLVGGTQANLVLISAALRSYQAVIAAASAHIHVHETGAIEAVGHKIITLPSEDGKIAAKQVRDVVISHRNNADAEHTVQPKMVYISNPTEYGALYSLEQLQDLSNTCKELGLLLYMDGARLGYGLASKENDLSLKDIGQLCDAFYIGGTKVGALFGEAMVITNSCLAEDFRYIIKQRGAMLAKGWLLGMQFCALFENDLYFEIASSANRFADQIRECLKELGYKFFISGSTNQIFVILPDSLLANLSEDFSYCYWEQYDQNHSVVRFCTSWATKETEVQALCDKLIKLTLGERG